MLAVSALIFAAVAGLASASPSADPHALLTRGLNIPDLVTRATNYTSYLPEKCYDACPTFATIYGACRTDGFNSTGCLLVCQQEEWNKWQACINCVEGNSDGHYGQSLQQMAERCVVNNLGDPTGGNASTSGSVASVIAPSGSSAAAASATASAGAGSAGFKAAGVSAAAVVGAVAAVAALL